MIAVHKVEVKNNGQTDEQASQEQKAVEVVDTKDSPHEPVSELASPKQTVTSGSTSIFSWVKKQTG